MISRAKGLAFALVLGFVAFLLWTTLAAQRVECTVSVEFHGKAGSGTASGATETSAAREAQTAACGPITGSMDDRIACSSAPPVTRRCREL